MTHARWFAPLLVWCGFAATAAAQEFPVMRWDPGAEDCEPFLQKTEARAFDETTIVIRQNPCVDGEANLLYLLIGADKALLIDSGATDDPRLTADLTTLVSSYLTKPDGSRLPLVVAHTHGHQDHRAGDAAFAAQPLTTVVPHEGEGMRKFFGFRQWPDDQPRFDLGGREVVLLPTPGHHQDHVVFVDTRTRLMFSGDFYLPGRLMVEDLEAYSGSMLALTELVNTWGVSWALGGHVEMDTRGNLYSSGSSFHPDERSLAMPFTAKEAYLLAMNLKDFNGFYSRHGDYVITNPVHNLIALAVGVLVAVVLLILGLRRFRRNRRSAAS
jgi:hydroxyacylglutathione hydrolase